MQNAKEEIKIIAKASLDRSRGWCNSDIEINGMLVFSGGFTDFTDAGPEAAFYKNLKLFVEGRLMDLRREDAGIMTGFTTKVITKDMNKKEEQ